MVPSDSIARTSSMIAAAISLIVAISIPFGYFAISSRYMQGSMNAEITLSARAIEELIKNSPNTWHYQGDRLEEMLHQRLDRSNPESRTIKDMEGHIIAQARESVADPVLAYRQPIHDSGREVAFIEVKRSLFPLLVRTIFLGLCSALPGVLIFLLFRSFPLRAVRRAYHALEESETSLRIYMENAPDGIYMTDTKGNFLYGNRKSEEITGYGRDELIGKNFLESGILSKQNLAKAIEVHRANVEDKSGESNEFEIISRDGTVIPVEITASLIKKVGQNVILGFIRDITRRKQMENALRESEEKYRIVIEKANEAIFIAQDDAFVFANRSLSDLLGVSATDLERTSFIDFIWPEDRETVVSNHRKRISGEVIPDSYDFRIIGAGNRLVWVFLSATVIQWKGKMATLNMMTDITHLKQAEEERKHSAKLAAALEMAGSVCHELNQPLQVISGNVGLLSLKNNDDKTRKTLEMIADQVNRMGTITRKLMGLKKYSDRDYVGTTKITDIDQTPDDDAK